MRIAPIVALLALVAAAGLSPGDPFLHAAPRADVDGAEVAWDVETIARGVAVPWELAISRDGQIFFTERAGRLSVIDRVGEHPRVLAEISETARSEDPSFATGLLGLALDPEYPREPYLYLYYTYADGAYLLNRLTRFKTGARGAVEDQVLLDKLPGSSWQNGGRIGFGPDGKLYVTTGGGQGGPQVYSQSDQRLKRVVQVNIHGDRLAQDLTSMACKILRINRDGSVPADNPFPGSAVYSYGHRNPQGLAWHPTTGKLYATEHGPPGGWDEVNLIEAGSNYGWPRFKGHTAAIKLSLSFFEPQRYVRPIAVYTPSLGPGGATVYSGKVFTQWKHDLFVASLAGKHLRRLDLSVDGRSVEHQERLLDGTYGRLRAVVEGPDGFLYLSTSNRDQAGSPTHEDDRILRIVPRRAPAT